MHDNVRRAPRVSQEYRQTSSPKDYRTRHDRESPARLSTTLVHAMADVMGRDVTETGSLVYDSVDPEAIDRIFSETSDGTARTPGHVAFAIHGYRVTVYSDGDIVITPPDAPTR